MKPVSKLVKHTTNVYYDYKPLVTGMVRILLVGDSVLIVEVY